MKTLLIDEILDIPTIGASCPIKVIAQDGEVYVLKTQYDGIWEDKISFSVYVETLAYKLLQKYDIENIPEIVYLDIDDDFIEDANIRFKDSEDEREQIALQNIVHSKGINLGVKWIDETEKYTNATDEFKKIAINFDGYLMNSDREELNPNIIYSKKEDKNYLIDFGNSFNCLMILDDNIKQYATKYYNKYSFDSKYLFKNHIQNTDMLYLDITQNDIDNILNILPQDWSLHKYKDEISNIVINRINNKEIMIDETTI